MPKKTGFDRYVDEQKKQRGFRSAYEKARREIDVVDQIVRALDEARIDAGLSKADLARSISAKPEVVRRLFTASAANPTLATIAKLAAALGCKLELVPVSETSPRTTSLRRASKAGQAA